MRRREADNDRISYSTHPGLVIPRLRMQMSYLLMKTADEDYLMIWHNLQIDVFQFVKIADTDNCLNYRYIHISITCQA